MATGPRPPIEAGERQRQTERYDIGAVRYAAPTGGAPDAVGALGDEAGLMLAIAAQGPYLLRGQRVAGRSPRPARA
jgi:hypothetical protein